MNLRKNLTCCASSPVCHLVALFFGSLFVMQLVHTHAHYQMEMDVDSYVTAFCKQNKQKCRDIVGKFDY